MSDIFFIHPSVEGHIGCRGCFGVTAITNKGSMKTVEKASLWQDEVYFGYVFKSGIP